MFHSISWQGYCLFIALTAAVYYVAVYLLYFRKHFTVLLPQKAKEEQAASRFILQDETSNDPFPNSGVYQSNLFAEPDAFDKEGTESDEIQVQACMDELKAYLQEAHRTRCEREELIHSLGSILQKYPHIRDSDFKESMTNVIVAQCQNKCSIRLSAADMVQVWFG